MEPNQKQDRQKRAKMPKHDCDWSAPSLPKTYEEIFRQSLDKRGRVIDSEPAAQAA